MPLRVDLQLSRDGIVVGTALLPQLTLNMGNNSVAATSVFQVRMLNLESYSIQLIDTTHASRTTQLKVSRL